MRAILIAVALALTVIQIPVSAQSVRPYCQRRMQLVQQHRSYEYDPDCPCLDGLESGQRRPTDAIDFAYLKHLQDQGNLAVYGTADTNEVAAMQYNDLLDVTVWQPEQYYMPDKRKQQVVVESIDQNGQPVTLPPPQLSHSEINAAIERCERLNEGKHQSWNR